MIRENAEPFYLREREGSLPHFRRWEGATYVPHVDEVFELTRLAWADAGGQRLTTFSAALAGADVAVYGRQVRRWHEPPKPTPEEIREAQADVERRQREWALRRLYAAFSQGQQSEAEHVALWRWNIGIDITTDEGRAAALAVLDEMKAMGLT